MSTPSIRCPRGLFVAEMLVAAVVVALLVVCEDSTCRMWIGAGSMMTVVPATIWGSAKRAIKIGYSSGEAETVANLLREHVRLQEAKEAN